MTEITADHVCGRFFAHPYPFDYEFCYLPKGHKGDCVFEPRRGVEDRKVPARGIEIDPREITVKLTGTEISLLVQQAVTARLEALVECDDHTATAWEDLVIKLETARVALREDGA